MMSLVGFLLIIFGEFGTLLYVLVLNVKYFWEGPLLLVTLLDSAELSSEIV